MNIRHLASLITSVALAWTAPSALAEEFPLKPLAEAPSSPQETFFKVEQGEAKIGGEVIKLFVVKPEHLTVSYRNETPKGLLLPNEDVFLGTA